MKKFIVAVFTVLAFGSTSEESSASDRGWYYVWDSCANCDRNAGMHMQSEEANIRFFISTPVYAGQYDYDCLQGALYNEIGLNGNNSNQFASKEKANREISSSIRSAKNDGFIVHRVSTPERCD